ncbi:hypothetical protein PPYR_09661 [Photinus pyralis]|uniref:F-box domain-containing protein n=1 Tax=Photinus pyralis TaxID=7054 RepID=A0A5N4AN72_PHOPY|nr:uncharacterized protein LOC116172253 [Photinus pyralis]XP_031345291.1 uncharacterized protein LOC116172253 [Photinus pyralis]KAB0798668.1 hypothetical protein PPYR_09661 [Photinus pyralis]
MDSDDEPLSKKFKLSTRPSVEEIPTSFNIANLPHLTLVNVLKYLDFKTVCMCATLCRSLYEASTDTSLYKNITLKHTMSKGQLKAYLLRVSRPRSLSIEYKWYDKRQQSEDYTEFNEYIILALKSFGQYLTSLNVESCRTEEVLSYLSECSNLQRVKFMRCKASFEPLPRITGLTHIYFLCSDIPNAVLLDTLKVNRNLKSISLCDNINLYVNGIAEVIGEYNQNVEKVKFCENRHMRAKGLKGLARCNKLRILELTGGPYHCDPEDSLQQMAAGCPLLERLVIYGWKGINDDNLMPVLQCCTQLKNLDLRGIDITIKSCREAALSLPLLKTMDVYKCSRIKKGQILKLQQEFQEIDFAIY